jgi:hypothetical protein
MNIAAQVATGNRRMVLEDVPDKMNPDDDDALEDVKPDEEKGMYTSEMDLRKGPVKLTQAQAAYQRAARQALKALKVPPQSQSPASANGSEWIWSQTKGFMRKNRHFKNAAATIPKSTNPFIPRSSTPVESTPPRPSTPVDKASPILPVMKASVPSDPPKSQGAGKKAAVKPAVSEASQPMTTRSVSRAGSLRPGVGGSGQKDPRVASSHPSKT